MPRTAHQRHRGLIQNLFPYLVSTSNIPSHEAFQLRGTDIFDSGGDIESGGRAGCGVCVFVCVLERRGGFGGDSLI